MPSETASKLERGRQDAAKTHSEKSYSEKQPSIDTASPAISNEKNETPETKNYLFSGIEQSSNTETEQFETFC